MIDYSKKCMEEIGAQDLTKLSFSSTLGALDDLEYQEAEVHSRVYFIENVHPDAELRKAAHTAILKMKEWQVEKVYNEKVYQVVEAFSQTPEAQQLKGEDKKYAHDLLQDFKRMGLHLEGEKKERLKTLKKKLAQKESEFSRNILEYSDQLEVSANELQGMEHTFIEGLTKTKDGKCLLSLDYPVYLPIMEHCENEEIRKQLLIKKYKTAHDSNPAILDEMRSLRKQMAQELGYSSWNDYCIEKRMAKSSKRIFDFLTDLEARLKPKAQKEREELTSLKRQHTGDASAQLKIWDYYFYSSLLKKTKYKINSQALKEYFPLPKVLSGMFEIVERLFQVKIQKVPATDHYRWHDEVELYQISDQKNGALGYFYLDLHPRQGKYGHAAAFGLLYGKYLPDGQYNRPVSAMVCNFPRGTQNQPALIPHSEVETLFHEFGHLLHNILTRAKFIAFSGTSVALDFVEAPSQVLENWVWDYDSLQIISHHFQNPNAKLEKALVEKMNEAKKAGSALFYLRQISLAKADLLLHNEDDSQSSIELSNQVLSDVFMEIPEGTCFAAGWGHMVGYASGYYSYAWADVMASDLFSLFRKQGVLNEDLGQKLRKEIYEPGGSRDENLSLHAFLGRDLDSQAFFEDLGAA